MDCNTGLCSGGWGGIDVKLRTHESAGDFTEDVTPGVRAPSRCGEKSPALARIPLKLASMGVIGEGCLQSVLLTDSFQKMCLMFAVKVAILWLISCSHLWFGSTPLDVD
jgi:hypothetical protein